MSADGDVNLRRRENAEVFGKNEALQRSVSLLNQAESEQQL